LKESWKINGLIVVLSALAWAGSFLLHQHYLHFLNRAPGIDLIFIPSGVRLIAIMIGGFWAAVGVCIGSLFLTGPEFHTAQAGVILAIAACSGFCPYLALRGSLWATGAGQGLAQLSAPKLPLIGLGVAVGSSVLHNLLFSVLGLEPWNTFAANASAMVAGDFVGTLLAVVIVFLMLRLYRKRTA
jgi:hypothetical protein